MITKEIAARETVRCSLLVDQHRRQPHGCPYCAGAYALGVKICEAAHWSAEHGVKHALWKIGDDPATLPERPA